MLERLLDPHGDAAIPAGHQVVTSEVEFLRLATGQEPLAVRGEKLCVWAETFFRAREIPYRVEFSVTRELRQTFPALSHEQIQELVRQVGDRLLMANRPWTVEYLLNLMYPLPLWRGSASVRHVAEWLLWVYQQDPADLVQPLLVQKAKAWQQKADERVSTWYSVTTREQAGQALERWLGITDCRGAPIRERFPLEVPAAFHDRARRAWREQIIESGGESFGEIEGRPIPFSLRQAAAQEVLQFLLKNPGNLSPHWISRLSSYLSPTELNQLSDHVPPTEPSSIPDTPGTVITWFLEEYLPYREWQHRSSSEKGTEKALEAAREFACWYLDCYPKALAGAPMSRWIGFHRVNQLDNPDCLVLVVVLDGLHAADARTLLQKVRALCPRLEVTANELVFTALPTVTEFAKESLLRGVPPDKVQEVGPIGTVLAEGKSPAQRFRGGRTGGLFLWRVLEPDRIYHQRGNSENLHHDVEGRLEAEAGKIREIVEAVPDEMTLQIVITSDHGRLLGHSERNIPVPDGMQAHGRAAWGVSGKTFPEAGYLVEGNLVYLYGESYGIPTDAAIPLDESAFRTQDDRGGTEPYAHGGLFPEEVIVPWIELARDAGRPEVKVTLSGRGRARKRGTLTIKVLNMSQVELLLEEVILSLPSADRRLEPNLRIGAYSPTLTHDLELDPWPSPAELKSAVAVARLRQPNRLLFEYPAQVEIRSEDMYERADEILEDLL